MTIEILKSPKKIQEIGTVYPWQNRNFYPSFRWTLCPPFWKSLTQDLTSHWQAGCTTDFLGDTSPPRHPSRDLYFCEYYALPSRIFRDLFARIVQVRLPDRFWWGSSLDCKTVRICGCSSTREQSNKRSGKRLKTESETWEETLKIRTVRFAYVIFVRITRFSQPRAIRIGKISMQAVNKLSSNVTARDA